MLRLHILQLFHWVAPRLLVLLSLLLPAAPHIANASAKAERPAVIPAVLDAHNAKVYGEIFQQQRALNRAKVHAAAEQLTDPTLLGHAAAIRLLHPDTKASFTDLQAWLQRYADHPQADDIYQLAQRRNPNAAPLTPPQHTTGAIAKYSDPDYTPTRTHTTNHPNYRDFQQRLTHLGQQDDYLAASRLLLQPTALEILGPENWAVSAITFTRRLLHKHGASTPPANAPSLQAAAALSTKAATLDSSQTLLAHWLSSLTHYQLQDFPNALQSLRKIIHTAPPHSNAYARAAWWAARIYAERNTPDLAQVYLKLAAQNPMTFYGQLAQSKLPHPPPIAWHLPALDHPELEALLAYPAIRRTIALSQIGEYALAQQELKTLYPSLPSGYDDTLLQLATALHLPHLAVTFALNLRDAEQPYYAGLYPLPSQWAPYGGERVNQALMYAIMRQESTFDPTLISRAGARGLMQIMPSTARHIRTVDGQPPLPLHRLFEPRTNVTLSQAYILELQQEFTDVVPLIAAYNAGPGNVRNWWRSPLNTGDPVLFIEQLPFGETRQYVKRVLTNFWLYQQRLNQTPTTRITLAQQAWPTRLAALPVGPAS